ncbi:uncharacterized protein LOC135077598 [Ostrinia nubilalis]|uniref:uncharacterized protein LOC135077598 n=1 Tax=Ostrinia nubilalis TaxID=29057 RepID=UPI00308233BB
MDVDAGGCIRALLRGGRCVEAAEACSRALRTSLAALRPLPPHPRAAPLALADLLLAELAHHKNQPYVNQVGTELRHPQCVALRTSLAALRPLPPHPRAAPLALADLLLAELAHHKNQPYVNQVGTELRHPQCVALRTSLAALRPLPPHPRAAPLALADLLLAELAHHKNQPYVNQVGTELRHPQCVALRTSLAALRPLPPHPRAAPLALADLLLAELAHHKNQPYVNQVGTELRHPQCVALRTSLAALRPLPPHPRAAPLALADLLLAELAHHKNQPYVNQVYNDLDSLVKEYIQVVIRTSEDMKLATIQ